MPGAADDKDTMKGLCSGRRERAGEEGEEALLPAGGIIGHKSKEPVMSSQ